MSRISKRLPSPLSPKVFKEKAQEIVDLYVAKKNKNSRTAMNAINTISQPRYQRSGQAEVDYQAVVKKYGDAEPMERELSRKKLKTYSATMILFKKVEDWNAEKKKDPDPTLLVPATEALRDDLKTRKYRGLRQFYIGMFDIRLDAVDVAWLNEVHETLIRKDRVVSTKEWRSRF